LEFQQDRFRLFSETNSLSFLKKIIESSSFVLFSMILVVATAIMLTSNPSSSTLIAMIVVMLLQSSIVMLSRPKFLSKKLWTRLMTWKIICKQFDISDNVMYETIGFRWFFKKTKFILIHPSLLTPLFYYDIVQSLGIHGIDLTKTDDFQLKNILIEKIDLWCSQNIANYKYNEDSNNVKVIDWLVKYFVDNAKNK